jgi:diaminohydroxyphosphoribosylaminopyrimidine deaminase / 5-amino-6-(5-phosphoribosylamino)uracil reductase
MLEIKSSFIESAYAHCADLSRSVLGKSAPNPNVSAAIYNAHGELIADGAHDRSISLDHAEIVALKKSASAAQGATLVVSLEPCNHVGSTPACVDAIIAAGISRVVYAVADPNPVAAGGAQRLKEAGVQVDFIASDELKDIQGAWLHRISSKRPYFIWKVATTLDGYIAAIDGTSQWISSEESRADVHVLRSQSDAILVGTGTALADNPTLQPRVAGASALLRIVMGERDIPADYNLYQSEGETIFLKSHDVKALLETFSERAVNQVLVEAGPTLGTALLKAGVIDEILIYQAPVLLGAGKNWVADLGIKTIKDGMSLTQISTEQIGPDLKSRYRVGAH